jgi:hypothetical protein
MWLCTECDVENDLDPEVEEKQIVTCSECGHEYEVASLGPLKLTLLDVGVAVEGGPDPDGEDDPWGE